MDPNQFVDGCPGQLVKIQLLGQSDFAFIPNDLPPDWQLPGGLVPLLAEVRQLIGTLDGIGRVLPNPGILLRPLERREAIQSSAIEGTIATPQQLLLFESENDETTANPRTDTLVEVNNCRKALQFANQDEMRINGWFIRQLHQTLLQNLSNSDQVTPGTWRTGPVVIGASRRFIPPPAEHIAPCLESLEKFIEHDRQYDPLIRAFLAHYQFEAIHPFRDGNGRVGRLLLTIMLKRQLHLTKPWILLSDYFHQHKDEYIGTLFNVSRNGDWNGYIEYCLNAARVQTAATISRCQTLIQLRDNYLAKAREIGGDIRLSRLVEQLFDSPIIRPGTWQRQQNITYPTAANDLKKLVDAGILIPLDQVTPKTYWAAEIYRVAYQDITRE